MGLGPPGDPPVHARIVDQHHGVGPMMAEVLAGPDHQVPELIEVDQDPGEPHHGQGGQIGMQTAAGGGHVRPAVAHRLEPVAAGLQLADQAGAVQIAAGLSGGEEDRQWLRCGHGRSQPLGLLRRKDTTGSMAESTRAKKPSWLGFALVRRWCYNVLTVRRGRGGESPYDDQEKLIKEHGNSLALVIDRSILDLLAIDDQTPLEISTDGRALVIAPVHGKRRHGRFEESLAACNRRYGKALKRLAGNAVEPTFLTLNEIVAIHRDRLAAYGGCEGVRDWGLLQSALAMPAARFGGRFLHGDLCEMAAAYLFHLVQNHPFLDGNKRVGTVAAYVFLALNDVRMTADADAYANLVLAVARGETAKSTVAEFSGPNRGSLVSSTSVAGAVQSGKRDLRLGLLPAR